MNALDAFAPIEDGGDPARTTPGRRGGAVQPAVRGSRRDQRRRRRPLIDDVDVSVAPCVQHCPRPGAAVRSRTARWVEHFGDLRAVAAGRVFLEGTTHVEQPPRQGGHPRGSGPLGLEHRNGTRPDLPEHPARKRVVTRAEEPRHANDGATPTAAANLGLPPSFGRSVGLDRRVLGRLDVGAGPQRRVWMARRAVWLLTAVLGLTTEKSG